MKRVTLSVGFVFFAVSAFAGGQQRVDVGVSAPVFIAREYLDGYTTETEITSSAINISGTSLFNDTIGVGVYGSFIFPQELTLSVQGYRDSVTIYRSDYNFIFGLDMLLGPVFVAVNAGIFQLPVSVGAHAARLSSATPAGRSDETFVGLGANVAGEFTLSEHIYLFVRLQLTLDFYDFIDAEVYGYSTTKGGSELTAVGVNPSLGIGFSW